MALTDQEIGARGSVVARIAGHTVWLTKEAPACGYSKPHGELLELTYDVECSTAQDNLKRRGANLAITGVPYIWTFVGRKMGSIEG